MTITSLTQSYRFFQREQGILESSRNVIFAACHTGFSQKDPVSAPDDIAPFRSVPVKQGNIKANVYGNSYGRQHKNFK